MKKVFALLMIAVILVLSLSAVAEQQAESFIFRNGITWGMSTGEVFAQEGEGEKGESPAPETEIVRYPEIKISKYMSSLYFTFMRGGLRACAYVLDDADQDTFGYLSKVYDGKYGTGTEADEAERVSVMTSVLNMPESSLLQMDAPAIRKWELADGTQIWLYCGLDQGKPACRIIYLAPAGLFAEPAAEEELDYEGV